MFRTHSPAMTARYRAARAHTAAAKRERATRGTSAHDGAYRALVDAWLAYNRAYNAWADSVGDIGPRNITSLDV